MASPVVSCGLKALDFARRITLCLINDIPPDKLWYQPVSAGNHVLWIAGHLATADDFYLRGLGNRETGFPPEWRGLFGMGSTPQADASSYPALSDVKEQLSRMRVGLVEFFSGLSDEQLAQPLPGDFATFAPDFGTLASTIAWHEGLHAGQLTVIRKALGLKPSFG